MYGTIAKLIAKPGAIEEIRRMETGRRPAGYVDSYVFQSDQDAEFRKLMNYLVIEPDWHDGEIVFPGK